jgi:hypothetical protein
MAMARYQHYWKNYVDGKKRTTEWRRSGFVNHGRRLILCHRAHLNLIHRQRSATDAHVDNSLVPLNSALTKCTADSRVALDNL